MTDAECQHSGHCCKVTQNIPFLLHAMWYSLKPSRVTQHILEMGRSSAEEFGRMFGSVRLGNVRLFGRAELRQTFGVIGASNWRRFALAAGVNRSQYTYFSSQLSNYMRHSLFINGPYRLIKKNLKLFRFRQTDMPFSFRDNFVYNIIYANEC